MLANALLIRWSDGWAQEQDAGSISTHGRKEATMSLGAVQGRREVTQIAAEQFAIYTSTRTQITADIEPANDDDSPFLSFGIGDRITVPDSSGSPSSERVIAITVSEDKDGRITYAPELSDLILEAQERLTDRIRKISTGTAGMS